MYVALIFAISFISLLWAADHIVTGASGLAIRSQMSPFLIGLTVVAIGTTIPELLIAFFSSLKNKNTFILGNAIGFNIANIGLVLGVSILIKPATAKFSSLKKIYPIILIAMLLVYSLILDDILGRVDGCLFLIACIALIAYFIFLSTHAPKTELLKEFKSAISVKRTLQTHIFSLLLGLIVLPLSSKYLMQSITELARWSGMKEMTIGLTITAMGIMLPGLITAMTAAFKGEEEIAAGTILGANICSLILIPIVPAIFTPAKISSVTLWQDLPVMLSLTLLLLFLNFHYKKKITPWHGGILLVVSCSYLISVVLRAPV